MDEVGEGRLEIADVGGPRYPQCQAERTRGFGEVFDFSLDARVIRIDDDGDQTRLWKHLVEQAEPFGLQTVGQEGDAGDIASGSIQTGDEPCLDRIEATAKTIGRAEVDCPRDGCPRGPVTARKPAAHLWSLPPLPEWK